MITNTSYQMSLFEAMPWPTRPYASDNLSHGVWRCSLEEAMQLPYIQHNPARRIWALIFDVDRPGAVFAWDEAGLPPPTWTAMTPESGHAHLAYTLKAPVAQSDIARLKPLRLLARIQHAMTEALGADRSYAGLITKTPAHEQWITRVWREAPYDLGELQDYLPDNLPLPQKITRSEAAGYGRNVSLFDSLRQWAYRARLKFDKSSERAAWEQECQAKALEINSQFSVPLKYNEVRHVAKSVATWTWARICKEDFSAIQSHRGKLSGISRASTRMDNLQRLLELDR